MTALYEQPKNALLKPSHVSGSMLKTSLTNIDENTAISLTFDKLGSQAVSYDVHPESDFSDSAPKGNIMVDAPIYRPHTVRMQYLEKTGSDKVAREEVSKWHNGARRVRGEGGARGQMALAGG